LDEDEDACGAMAGAIAADAAGASVGGLGATPYVSTPFSSV
jgi:hypothetical protein